MGEPVLLDVSAGLFLVAAAFRLFIGVATPIALRGVRTVRILFVSTRSDTRTYGVSPEAWVAKEPALRTYRDAVWTIIAGFLTGSALLEASLAWFPLRDGEWWALWALTAEGAVHVAYGILALRPYIGARAPLGLRDLPPFMWIPAALLGPAALCGFLGLA